MRQQLETAVRLTLAAQVRNRLAWTAAFALLGLVVLRLRLHRPARPARVASAGSPEPAPAHR
jgi:hypothetical protein